MLNGEFDPQYAGYIDAVLAQVTSLDMTVVLDAHQYGRRRENGQSYIIGETETVTSRHFAQFWSSAAARWRNNRVIFNLTNEPNGQDLGNLVRVQNEAIVAIRETGAANLILASGSSWSGVHSWISSGNAAAMLAIRDPKNNFGFDVHQYLDGDSSGQSATCTSGAATRLEGFSEWARTNRRRGFLGEFAGADNAVCTDVLTALLRHVRDNNDVWIGWTFWAGGAWWPESYFFSLRPRSMQSPADRPQMTLLRQFFQ